MNISNMKCLKKMLKKDKLKLYTKLSLKLIHVNSF